MRGNASHSQQITQPAGLHCLAQRSKFSSERIASSRQGRLFPNGKLSCALSVLRISKQAAMDLRQSGLHHSQIALQAFFGGCNRSTRSWLTAQNLDLDSRPIESIDSPAGLRTICNYLGRLSRSGLTREHYARCRRVRVRIAPQSQTASMILSVISFFQTSDSLTGSIQWRLARFSTQCV